MKQGMLTAAVVLLYLLHQDFWFWRRAMPVVWGVLPIGLFYHICFTLAVVLLMLALVKFAWPTALESDSETSE